MNLHTAPENPAWEVLPPEEQNRWQKIAGATDGLITPANLLGIASVPVFFKGALDYSKDRTKGLKLMAGALATDLIDGKIAEITGTKSKFGAGVDAVRDKVAGLAGLWAITKRGDMPKEVGGAIALHHSINSIISTVAWSKGSQLSPSKEGKEAIAMESGAVALFALSAALKEKNHPRTSRLARVGANILAISAIPNAVKSSVEYASRTFDLKPSKARTKLNANPNSI